MITPPNHPDPLTPLPVLAYHNPGPRATPPEPTWLRVASLAVSLLAATSAFLPFAYNTSPLDVLRNPFSWTQDVDLLLVAIPFFAGVVAAAWKLRLLRRPTMNHVERRAAWATAALFAAPGLFVAAKIIVDDTPAARELVKFLCGPAATAAGAALAAWFATRGHPAKAATTALDAAYTGNALLLLIDFIGSAEIGWKITLIAVACIALDATTSILRTIVRSPPRGQGSLG